MIYAGPVGRELFAITIPAARFIFPEVAAIIAWF